MTEAKKKSAELIAGLEKELKKAKNEIEYYKQLSAESGRKSLREVNRLSQAIAERKKTEEELLYQKVYFEELVNNAPEAIVLHDCNDIVININKEFTKMFGYTHEDVIGKSINDLIASDNFRSEADILSSKVLNGEKVYFETKRKRRDGVLIDVSTLGAPIIKDGKQIGVYAIYRDISERKKNEDIQQVIHNIFIEAAKIETLHGLLKMIHIEIGKLMDARNFYVAIYNKESGKYLFPFYVDEYIVVDTTKPVNLGKGLTEYVRTTKKPLLIEKKEIQKLEKSKKIVNFGKLSESWLGVPLIRGNETLGVIAVQSYTDSKAYTEKDLIVLDIISGQLALIIDRKKAEAALRENEEKYRTVVEKAHDSIAIIQDGKFVYLNQALANKAGTSKFNLLGSEFRDYIHPDDFTRVMEYNRRRMNGEKVPEFYEAKFINLARNEIHAEISVGNIKFMGKPAALIMIRDITERKQMEQMLIQSEKMASIGTLAAGVAHEINNPVCYTLLNLELLKEYFVDFTDFIEDMSNFLTDQGKDKTNGKSEIYDTFLKFKKNYKIDYLLKDAGKAVNASLTGSKKVQDIASDLKDFSRADTLECFEADINNVLEKSLNIVWNKVKYIADVEKDFGDIPEIECDVQRLSQVFINILINAAQAIEKWGKITLRTFRENGSVTIQISDSGSGIPDEKIGKIFDAFYTTKGVGEGTGLGLSISYKIIKDHNGRINVESKVGIGTTFTIKLPIDRNNIVKDFKILIVDDDDYIREYLYTIVSEYNSTFPVRLAKNGFEAAESLNTFKPDIVLLDINMPGMNGLEVCRKIKSDINLKETKVLVISGLDQEEYKQKSYEAGADKFLKKPVPKNILTEILNNITQPETE